MAYVSMKQMLETGVHFGHQTRRWNPKMRPYIFGARNGIHIIDLQQTVKLFRVAYDKVVDTVAKGGKVLFIGTKRQAQEAVATEATKAGQYYVTNRWMGGTLTNFVTIQKSVDRLKKLEGMFADGSINRYQKKEVLLWNARCRSWSRPSAASRTWTACRSSPSSSTPTAKTSRSRNAASSASRSWP